MPDDTGLAAVVESLQATASELQARPHEDLNHDWADRMAAALAAAGLLAAPAPEEATTDTVVAERRRQVQVKGFTTEHDLRYTNGELVSAALAYLTGDPAWWPWQDVPEGRSAVKAGAMLLAERDRHLAEVGLRALREGRR
jgi:hypothetical protein